jgi:hypothetical protein
MATDEPALLVVGINDPPSSHTDGGGRVPCQAILGLILSRDGYHVAAFLVIDIDDGTSFDSRRDGHGGLPFLLGLMD